MSIYYDPEEVGLEVVAEIDYSDGEYQFDYRVVWWHEKKRKLYTSRDSGCSCPSPFEEIYEIKDLDKLSDMIALRAEVRSDGPAQNTPEQIQTFLHRVETVLRRTRR